MMEVELNDFLENRLFQTVPLPITRTSCNNDL